MSKLAEVAKSLVQFHDDCEAIIIAAEDEIQELRQALLAIRDGDYPATPPITRWRQDGQPSKEDRCAHGERMADFCEGCVCEFINAVLTGEDAAK